MTRKLIRLSLAAAIIIVIVGLSLIDLERVPPMWWDEGWTMLVARTWVERGFYGRLLDGELAPPGLNAAFPTTASVALSFKLFGIGVWQARLPGVLYTLGVLALLYSLARRVYGQRVGGATLAVALLTPVLPDLQPLLMGRQVLAEMPGLFFLLAGYAAAIDALERSGWRIVAAGLLWAIALHSKLQFQPFWAVSLALTLGIALAYRWRQAVRVLPVCGAATGLAYVGLSVLRDGLLAGRTWPMPDMTGLLQATALITTPVVRLEALKLVLTFGLPTVLGLLYAGWRWRRAPYNEAATRLGQAMLWGMASSWLLWFGALSAAWSRYLFPAVIIGSMFTAKLLADVTQEFHLLAAVRQAAAQLRGGHVARGLLAVLAINVVTGAGVILTLQSVRTMLLAYAMQGNADARQVAEQLNVGAASDARIETYDSELFFFLDRRYHYPPDQIHVDLNRRTFLHEDVPIDYDPLAADPDYLIVGPFGRCWQLYDPVLNTGSFRLQTTIGEYDVYERVR